MHFSSTLLSIFSKEIGRQFSTDLRSPFLNMGETAAVFHVAGSLPRRLILRRSLCRAGVISRAVLLKKMGGRPFGPLVFVTSKDERISLILLLETLKFVRMLCSALISACVNTCLEEKTDWKKLFSKLILSTGAVTVLFPSVISLGREIDFLRLFKCLNILSVFREPISSS